MAFAPIAIVVLEDPHAFAPITVYVFAGQLTTCAVPDTSHVCPLNARPSGSAGEILHEANGALFPASLVTRALIAVVALVRVYVSFS
jgi:hypothetical protein